MADLRDKIPSPWGLPLLGNILDVQNENPIKGLEGVLDRYGRDIVKLTFFGRENVIVGSAALMQELCDERRFWKAPAQALEALQKTAPGVPKPRLGLFTAPSEEHEDWQQAHRILTPAFASSAVLPMFDEMYDLASQLLVKWAELGPSEPIQVTDDFTRLTLDTIALCAMDYRFNSFQTDEMHPFVEAMRNRLRSASDRLKLSSILRRFNPWDRTDEQLETDRLYLRKVSEEMVQARRDNPSSKRDLLNAMIMGSDPKTGESMDDELIAANMVTFLVAGHETTSGLLSFAFYELLKNPEAYAKARKEVDEVVGTDGLQPAHLKDLHYIEAVLRETLRLYPTAPAFTRGVRHSNPNEYEVIGGGKYAVKKTDNVLCLLTRCHTDPAFWGEDALQFKPERMLGENFSKVSKAWKPFGTGVRACIGRAFAWQEARMAIALLLQSFDFELQDPDYELKVSVTLTIKPEGFNMYAKLREGVTAESLRQRLNRSKS